MYYRHELDEGWFLQERFDFTYHQGLDAHLNYEFVNPQGSVVHFRDDLRDLWMRSDDELGRTAHLVFLWPERQTTLYEFDFWPERQTTLYEFGIW